MKDQNRAKTLGYYEPENPTVFIPFTSLQHRWLKDLVFRKHMIDEHECHEEESVMRDQVCRIEPDPAYNMSRLDRLRSFANIPIITAKQPGNEGTTQPRAGLSGPKKPVSQTARQHEPNPNQHGQSRQQCCAPK